MEFASSGSRETASKIIVENNQGGHLISTVDFYRYAHIHMHAYTHTQYSHNYTVYTDRKKY